MELTLSEATALVAQLVESNGSVPDSLLEKVQAYQHDLEPPKGLPTIYDVSEEQTGAVIVHIPHFEGSRIEPTDHIKERVLYILGCKKLTIARAKDQLFELYTSYSFHRRGSKMASILKNLDQLSEEDLLKLAASL